MQAQKGVGDLTVSPEQAMTNAVVGTNGPCTNPEPGCQAGAEKQGRTPQEPTQLPARSGPAVNSGSGR